MLEAAKQVDPGKAALKLMDVLFTDEEMSSSCFKPGSRRSCKPALDEYRVKLIEDCLLQYYGDTYSSIKEDVTRRCNQKCRDRARDKNKPRRSKPKVQLEEDKMNTLESKLDSLLVGQLQLMQAVFGQTFPLIHHDVPSTESFSGLSHDLPDPSAMDPPELI